MVRHLLSLVHYSAMHLVCLLGDPLFLVCGTGLASNPNAMVSWTAPDGTAIMANARYDLENGPKIVRLNLTHDSNDDESLNIRLMQS